MKRYVKSARYIGYSADKLNTQLQACRKDLKLLARCETVEDIESTQWNSWRFDKFLPRQIENGEDIDDVIEDAMASLYEEIAKLKKDIIDAGEYEIEQSQAFEQLKAACSKFEIVSEDDRIIIVAPPEGATHSDCIEFVDTLVSAIHGKYIETGRGGSWTSWNIVSDTGARFKAGWTHDDDWYVCKY